MESTKVNDSSALKRGEIEISIVSHIRAQICSRNVRNDYLLARLDEGVQAVSKNLK